jgi:hypothetical protein
VSTASENKKEKGIFPPRKMMRVEKRNNKKKVWRENKNCCINRSQSHYTFALPMRGGGGEPITIFVQTPFSFQHLIKEAKKGN